MICPKCKQQIPEKSLKCSFCSARIGTLCKRCATYNSIYNLNCVNCNTELLRVCPECKSINFPNSTKCRKCGHSFVPDGEVQNLNNQETERGQEDQKAGRQDVGTEKTEDLNGNENTSPQPSNPQKSRPTAQPLSPATEKHSQQKAKELLVKGLSSIEKRIISLSGSKGIGKTIVLKSAMHELKENEYTWLVGECSAITQLSPCGVIQDILLTFFNVANFCSDSLKLKKESQKFFQSEFPTLSNDEIFNLINFLYPVNTDYFENILTNKEKTFVFLEKVFRTIAENNKTVIVIDNFDLIDGLSYEFLHRFINSEPTKFPYKIILTYTEHRPARGYLYNEELKNNAYLDIALGNFDRNQTNAFIEQYFPNENPPMQLKENIYALSSGNPAIMEQVISLLIDFKIKNKPQDTAFPSTMEEVVKMRLNLLKERPNVYKTLVLAAIQGIKFYPVVINEVLKIETNAFSDIIKILQSLNFIIPVNEFAYSFKNSVLWNSILESVKKDSPFKDLNQGLFSVLANYTLSSNTLMAVLAQNLNQDLMALNIWTDNTKIASFIGDTNLYAISQKQCLVLTDKIKNFDATIIKNNTFERLGKLLTSSNPQEAMQYLPNAIANARKAQDPIKELELTGYLANCCMKMGDYFGTLECIDSAIEKLDSGFELEVAMMKSRKLNALLNIGNSGEIINLVDNEILPVFDKHIGKPHKNIAMKSLYKAWLHTYLALANALILQGNNRSFQVLSTLFEIFEKNNFDDQAFICKTKLALAFANTIKGDIESSEKILEEIIKFYKMSYMDNKSISRWNLINILNSFMHKKYSGLQEELFQVASFANNINDNFTKNILKTLLGKLFKDEENAKHAIEIFDEQITYFAKEKIAIGALLTWYLIADAKLVAEGPSSALEIAQKALDVAQNPKINNYLFIALFNKIMAEAYIVQSDFELAKVHIEQAVMIARKFELFNLMSDLYLLYGKYLQDIALVQKETKVDYAIGASKMYKKAYLIAQGIKNNYLLAQVEKARTVLNSFCQLNGITLKTEG